METIQDRIKIILERKNINAHILSGDNVALYKRTLRQIDGVSKMSHEIISSILETYPDISAEWLLRGEGEMYKNADHDTAQNQDIQNLKDEIQDLQREVIRLQRELLDMHSDDRGKKRTASS